MDHNLAWRRKMSMLMVTESVDAIYRPPTLAGGAIKLGRTNVAMGRYHPQHRNYHAKPRPRCRSSVRADPSVG
ncbi:hypothetical protein EVAR_36524_1 [Eumeta japonica]|uniref:Uncharacterized protein n=1 Tax=Eumeta variegata TaxID=151549 RepID=A0A4C1XBJ6_EUMVA|nr:hypothetical protein EVAR_36524_1 [Eumeta japonica]